MKNNKKYNNQGFFYVAQCIHKWTRIRENFRKGLRNRDQKSGSGASKRRSLKFEKELAFLKSYYQEHDQISNVQSLVSPEILELDTSIDCGSQEENLNEH